jgi:hypothetical protein
MAMKNLLVAVDFSDTSNSSSKMPDIAAAKHQLTAQSLRSHAKMDIVSWTTKETVSQGRLGVDAFV